MAVGIPDDVSGLLWDIDPSSVDLDRDIARITERVMSRGTLDAMRWLVRAYGVARLREQFVRMGPNRLPPRERAFWAMILELPTASTAASPALGGGRPGWAD